MSYINSFPEDLLKAMVMIHKAYVPRVNKMRKLAEEKVKRKQEGSTDERRRRRKKSGRSEKQKLKPKQKVEMARLSYVASDGKRACVKA